MKRVQFAVLFGQALSYVLIITFVFADAVFDLTHVLRQEGSGLTLPLAWVAACLVGLVGAINIWLTWYYMAKSNTIREWVIVCAWTHRIKRGGEWLSLEEFLSEHLGYQVSHGLSEAAYLTMRKEIDDKWAANQIEARDPSADRKPGRGELESGRGDAPASEPCS